MVGSQPKLASLFKPGNDAGHGGLSAFAVVAAALGLMLVPLIVLKMRSISSDVGIDNVMLALRYESAKGEGSGLGLLAYPIAWLTFASIAAVAHANETVKARIVTWILITIALVCQVLSASRTGVGILLFGLAGTYAMRVRKVSYRGALSTVSIFLGVFVAIGFVLGKANVEGLDTQSPVSAVVLMARHYFVSGLLAFDHVVQDPAAFKDGLHSLRFFAVMLDLLGMNVHVPDLVLKYVWTPFPTNVYTMYFPAYVDFGLAGVVVYTTLIGWVSGVFYRSARSGSMFGCAMFGVVFAKLLVSGITEHFVMSISYWIQAAIVFALMTGIRRDVEHA